MKCYRCKGDAWEHAWLRYKANGAVACEVVQCMWCGALMSRPASSDACAAATSAPPDSGDVFRFDSGRFQGKTLAEAADHPSGPSYLKWALSNVPRWSAAIKEYMSNAASSA